MITQSTPLRSVSLCQRTSAWAPITSLATCSASWSQLEPGRTTTPNFMTRVYARYHLRGPENYFRGDSMFCSKCGNALPSGSLSCRRCRTPVAQSADWRTSRLPCNRGHRNLVDRQVAGAIGRDQALRGGGVSDSVRRHTVKGRGARDHAAAAASPLGEQKEAGCHGGNLGPAALGEADRTGSAAVDEQARRHSDQRAIRHEPESRCSLRGHCRAGRPPECGGVYGPNRM